MKPWIDFLYVDYMIFYGEQWGKEYLFNFVNVSMNFFYWEFFPILI